VYLSCKDLFNFFSNTQFLFKHSILLPPCCKSGLEWFTWETWPGSGHLWFYLFWVVFHWICTIGKTSVVWFIVLSPTIDTICVQIFAAISCNSGTQRYVGVASYGILSNLGTRNLFCYSDLRWAIHLFHVYKRHVRWEGASQRHKSTCDTLMMLLNLTTNSPVAAGWNCQLLANRIGKKTFQKVRLTSKRTQTKRSDSWQDLVRGRCSLDVRRQILFLGALSFDKIISWQTKQHKNKILLVQEHKWRNDQMSVLLQIW